MLTAGGAMFAAFPLVCHTMFSGLPGAVVMLLIARKFEFRTRYPAVRRWGPMIFPQPGAGAAVGVALRN